jgi:hypothetical protein
MWTTLLGLIERWWREKPRLDVVRAVVHLRDAMQACESNYEAYFEAIEADGTDKSAKVESLERVWSESVDSLAFRVVALGTVLEIFGPNMHRQILEYSGYETDARSGAPLYAVACEMHAAPEIDIARVVLTDKYKAALAELDAFIRANFKPEEVHAAKSSRLR